MEIYPVDSVIYVSINQDLEGTKCYEKGNNLVEDNFKPGPRREKILT